jgi:hypothetical protein
MRFEEEKRSATSSVARVTGATPISGLNNRFLSFAMCGLAKHRSEMYFQVKQLTENPLVFEVSFPKEGPVEAISVSFPTNATAPNVFPVSSCP